MVQMVIRTCRKGKHLYSERRCHECKLEGTRQWREGKGIQLREYVDHVIPLAKGGVHALPNLVPACASCNWKKSTKIWEPVRRHPWMVSDVPAKKSEVA